MISLTAVSLIRAVRVSISRRAQKFANEARLPSTDPPADDALSTTAASSTSSSSLSSPSSGAHEKPTSDPAGHVDAPHAESLVVVVGTEATAERLAGLLLMESAGAQERGGTDGEREHGSESGLTAEQVRVEPVIRLTWPQELAPLDAALARIARGEMDWLILLSRTAVEFLVARCAARGVPEQALAGMRLACVGSGTAEAAEEKGLRPSWVPSAATGAALVEEALASGIFRDQRVFVPRSAIGDDEMLEPLRTQVAELHLVSAYENRPQPIDEAVWLRYAQWESGPVVAFLSSSAVTALWSGLPLSVQEQLARSARWLAIGPSTAETMQQVHWPPRAVAEPPGLESLAALIKREFAT